MIPALLIKISILGRSVREFAAAETCSSDDRSSSRARRGTLGLTALQSSMVWLTLERLRPARIRSFGEPRESERQRAAPIPPGETPVTKTEKC